MSGAALKTSTSSTVRGRFRDVRRTGLGPSDEDRAACTTNWAQATPEAIPQASPSSRRPGQVGRFPDLVHRRPVWSLITPTRRVMVLKTTDPSARGDNGVHRVPDAVSECLCSKGPCMKRTETRAVIDRYFDLMGRGEDFATCYADEVRWTTFDGATTVAGSTEVRDYLIALHRNMPDSRTRPIVYAEGTAYVEGDCADPRGVSTDRIAFCVAYDVANGVITSARCYGAIGFLGPVRGVHPPAGRTN
jgi:hypothetical protein